MLKVHRKENGASEMELLILSKPWVLQANYTIELHLSSSVELNILERIEQGVLTHVRRTLNNRLFKITSAIKEIQSKDKLYTDRDKYEFMVKENPHLQKLKDELGLDFEF